MARTTPPDPHSTPPRPYDARRISEIAASYGIEMTSVTQFKAQIDSQPFAEVLNGTGMLSMLTRWLVYSMRYGLTSADARMPRRLTKKDRAAVQLIVLEMSQLKSALEDMLKRLEDWAESRVAMTAHADGNHRERSV
jgi:hypothetical protein